MIYVFSKAGAYYNRKDIEGDYKNSNTPNHIRSGKSHIVPRVKYIYKDNTGKRCALSVISEIKKTTKGAHPTEKPSELYRFLIERYCPPGGTILDPTAGSFNSCFTAYELDRHAIGIEKDEEFYKKADKRADNLT
jgi:site-specific DNA-methyltransferase (adenine-specific)